MEDINKNNEENTQSQSPVNSGSEHKTWTIFKHREEYEKNRDIRQLKHWIIKALIGSLVFTLVSVVLSMSYTVVVLGKSFDQSLLGAFLNSFVDLIKFVLT